MPILISENEWSVCVFFARSKFIYEFISYYISWIFVLFCGIATTTAFGNACGDRVCCGIMVTPKASGAYGHSWRMMTKDANIAILGNCCVYPQWLRVIIDVIIDAYLWSMSMYLSSKISQWYSRLDVLIQISTWKYISKERLTRFSRRSFYTVTRYNKFRRKTFITFQIIYPKKEISRVLDS